jgi:PAS domain S-box-containing protein
MSLKDNEQNYQFKLTSKKLKGIFDSALDGIITVNDCGTIQSFNLAAERIFGYSADEVIGSNYKILIPNYFINKYDTHLSRYINTGETVISGARRILHGRTKNGQIVPLELSLSSIKINNELILTGILRDISERILMEQKILTAYNELESFSYIAAHDLREPLRGISNYATFLIEDYQDKIDTEGINKLQTLKKLSLRLENFIESLLHYSKLSNGDKEYTVEEANHLVNEVIAGLDIMIKENNVQIIFHRNLPAILCNAILVTELFFNLISNSIKYNDKNKKIVEIGCIKDDENYNYQTVFFVKDNGIGIKEEHFNIIFRIFKRLHPRDQFGGGSGAGLAIVKKIVTMHNGKIWLESELNKGTTFYFTLGQYEK